MSSLRDRKSSRTDAADAARPARPAEIVIGQVVAVTEDGAPVVDFAGNPAGAPVPALATARFDQIPCGTAVALMFVQGDPAQPIALGVVGGQTDAPTPQDSLTLTAAREIVLQCGRASLVLTRAGKVLLRGSYVSLRSSGMQRITGASVQIN